jgi:hypothetical protein
VCLLGMIVSLFGSIRNKENEKLIILELLVLCAICISIPLILGWLPWRYSYHHAVYARYIAQNGHIASRVSAPWLPPDFESWPGSHLLLGIYLIVLDTDPILSYHALCVLLGLMAVLFLYLLVKSITKNQQLAAFSALSLGLLTTFVQGMAHEIHSELAEAMIFFMLYALVALRPAKMAIIFASFSALAFIVALISHSLVPAMYVLILAAIWLYGSIYGRKVKLPSMQIRLPMVILCIALVAFYWLYVVTRSYAYGWIDYFKKEIPLVFQEGLPSPFSVVSEGNTGVVFPRYLSILKDAHLALYISLGLIGVAGIFLSTIGKWKEKPKTLWFTIPWVMVLLLLAVLFMTGIGGTTFPFSRILDFLFIPLAIGCAMTILLLLRVSPKANSAFRAVVSCVFIFMLFLGVFTANPFQLYQGKFIPLETSSADKSAATWVEEYSKKDSSVFSDVHTSEAVLYWGYRQACFDDRIDTVFTSHDALEVEKTLGQFNYASFNIFNIDQGFYYRWAKFGAIPANSVIVNIDHYNYMAKIYASGNNTSIYQIVP